MQGFLECRPKCRPIIVDRKALAATRRSIAVWMWHHPAEFGASLVFRGIHEHLRPPFEQITVGRASGASWPEMLQSEQDYLEAMASDAMVAGAIVWYIGGERNRQALEHLQKMGKALVFVDRLPPEGIEADFVGTDNRHAAFEATRHLIKLGHRRIVFASNEDPVSSVRDRIAGYRDALEAASIPICDDDVVPLHVTERLSFGNAAREIVGSLMKREQPPTALFAVNDQVAIHLQDAIQEAGLRIPQDIALMGFDGQMRWVPGGGGLTTVNQDFERMGAAAMRLMLERLQFNGATPIRHRLLDGHLVIRSSTRAAADRH
jgi:LacI family transcriptional regulator